MNLNKTIEDNIIDKEKLVFKRYKFLNIGKDQAQFISLIFKSKGLDYKNLSVDQISSILNLDIETVNKILSNLVTNSIVKVNQSPEGETTFDFDYLVVKLMNTYLPPKEDSSMDLKLSWIINSLDLELNDENKNQLKNYINDRKWSSVCDVVNKLADIEDTITWPLLSESLDVHDSTSKTNKDIKKVLDNNWLED